MIQASDREFADILISHINKPCIDPLTGANIRKFYISEAEKALPTFKDLMAKKQLEKTILKYSIT
jgi:hypothetical protein